MFGSPRPLGSPAPFGSRQVAPPPIDSGPAASPYAARRLPNGAAAPNACRRLPNNEAAVYAARRTR